MFQCFLARQPRSARAYISMPYLIVVLSPGHLSAELDHDVVAVLSHPLPMWSSSKTLRLIPSEILCSTSPRSTISPIQTVPEIPTMTFEKFRGPERSATSTRTASLSPSFDLRSTQSLPRGISGASIVHQYGGTGPRSLQAWIGMLMGSAPGLRQRFLGTEILAFSPLPRIITPSSTYWHIKGICTCW